MDYKIIENNTIIQVLKLVKEVSVDCSLNINDTKDALDPFTCLNYGSNTSYSYD